MARLRIAIGSLVAIMWAISVAATMVMEGYEMSPFVHLAMMAVVGALFGVELVRRNGAKE